jgi:iron complex outermembrane receptor protein
VAIERDRYDPEDVPRFAYSTAIPGVFVQADISPRPWIGLTASGRLDHHSRHGWIASPRLAALFRLGSWTSRGAIGTGFVGPTPLTEDTEAAGLTRLRVVEPLEAERGLGGSIDIGRTDGPLSWSATFFASRVSHPARIDPETYVLATRVPDETARGLDLVATVRRAPLALTATYTFVRSRERAGVSGEAVPLTPRHSAGVVAMIEREDAGRVGLEVYVTGRQRLEHNPYRAASEPYVIVGLLAERPVGPVRLFINGENLTGVRQGDWDSVLRPDRAVDGRWTVDAWAPLDGRVINGGIRWQF